MSFRFFRRWANQRPEKPDLKQNKKKCGGGVVMICFLEGLRLNRHFPQCREHMIPFTLGDAATRPGLHRQHSGPARHTATFLQSSADTHLLR